MSWSKLCLSGGHKGWWSLKGQTISAITLCHKCHFNKSSPRRGWMRSYFTCSTITFRSFHATMLIPEDRRAWAGAQTAIWVHMQESISTRAGNSRTVMFKSMFFRKQKLFRIVFFFPLRIGLATRQKLENYIKWNVWGKTFSVFNTSE